jgi:endoribonuclease LACTB2
MTDYIRTLNRIKKLDLIKIGPGHGDWVTKPYEKIQFVLERRIHRENQIKTLLVENKELTVEQLTEFIYQNTIHPSVVEVARKTVEAHLLKLLKDGVVQKRGNVYYILP